MLQDAFELKVLIQHAKEPVVAYASMWNGKKYYHIRKLYSDGTEWKPGKGLSVPYDQKTALIGALCA